MKLVCEREKLLHAFQTAASVAPSRSPKPILQNIKLEVASERVMLMATDLEVGIRLDVSGVTVETPGVAVLPIARFGSILRESSDEKLTIESDGQKIVVRGQQSQFHLPSENADEFPAVAAFEAENYHEVSARFFAELIRRTVFATDAESSRYALGGVKFELTDEGITGIGTDGRRLAVQEGPAKSVGGHATGDAMTIVPVKAMNVLRSAIADNEENVLVAVRDNDILVKSGRTTISSGLVEGRYPKWRDVFPRGDDMAKIEMLVGPFFAAVRQAAIVTSDKYRGVAFTFGDGRVTLAGHGAEFGESHIELPIAYDGPDIVIMLDPRFMADFLKVLGPERTFTLEVRDGKSAAVCRTDDGYAYVIMPLAQD